MQHTTFGPTGVFSGVTLGAPFQADFEQSISSRLPNGKREQISLQGSIYRDAKGRRRQDMRVVGVQGVDLAFSYIHDTVANVMYVLDGVNKTGTREEYFQSKESNTGSDLAVVPEALNSEISVEHREGLECRVYRMKIPGEIEFESWFSVELREVVFEKRVTPSEEKTIRLVNIKRVEPSSERFVIPQGYEITETKKR